jgi:hypothetical protein
MVSPYAEGMIAAAEAAANACASLTINMSIFAML